jgi:hypothetical protein
MLDRLIFLSKLLPSLQYSCTEQGLKGAHGKGDTASSFSRGNAEGKVMGENWPGTGVSRRRIKPVHWTKASSLIIKAKLSSGGQGMGQDDESYLILPAFLDYLFRPEIIPVLQDYYCLTGHQGEHVFRNACPLCHEAWFTVGNRPWYAFCYHLADPAPEVRSWPYRC